MKKVYLLLVYILIVCLQIFSQQKTIWYIQYEEQKGMEFNGEVVITETNKIGKNEDGYYTFLSLEYDKFENMLCKLHLVDDNNNIVNSTDKYYLNGTENSKVVGNIYIRVKYSIMKGNSTIDFIEKTIMNDVTMMGNKDYTQLISVNIRKFRIY